MNEAALYPLYCRKSVLHIVIINIKIDRNMEGPRFASTNNKVWLEQLVLHKHETVAIPFEFKKIFSQHFGQVKISHYTIVP